MSDTPEGDRYGLVSSLQLAGAGPIIASSAPLPDFYMPIFSALYWHCVSAGDSSSRALANAKRRFRDGDWPEALADQVHEAYRQQILDILTRFRGLGSNPERLALAESSEDWLWPTGPAFDVVHSHLAERRFEALFKYLVETKREQSIAVKIATHLVRSKDQLPEAALDQISAFLMAFG